MLFDPLSWIVFNNLIDASREGPVVSSRVVFSEWSGRHFDNPIALDSQAKV